MVQATVAAHISAICAGALRYRDEILAATSKSKSAATPETEAVATPVPLPADYASCATTTTTHGRDGCLESPGGRALERGGITGGLGSEICGDRDGCCGGESGGGGGADPAGHPHHERKVEAQEHVCETSEEDSKELEERKREGDGGTEETEETNASTPATAAAAAAAFSSRSSTACAAPAATSPTAVAYDTENGQWWEEDEEDEEDYEEEKVCEEGAQTDDAAGRTKTWRGTTSIPKTSNTGGGAGGGTGSSRWIRRREREIPFLGLLVRSQVLAVDPVGPDGVVHSRLGISTNTDISLVYLKLKAYGSDFIYQSGDHPVECHRLKGVTRSSESSRTVRLFPYACRKGAQSLYALLCSARVWLTF